MIKALRGRKGSAEEESRETEVREPTILRALHLLTAQLLLATGAGAALDASQHRGESSSPSDATEFGRNGKPSDRGPTAAAAWAPLLLGVATAAAHAVHVARPSAATHTTARALNGAVLGIGLAGVAESLYARATEQRPFSAAPLFFGSAGVLGFLLDRQEQEIEVERQRWERRASLVERWVPRRRTKVDKIVVHV